MQCRVFRRARNVHSFRSVVLNPNSQLQKKNNNKSSIKKDQMHRSKFLLLSSVQHLAVCLTFFSTTHTLAYFPPTQHRDSALNRSTWPPPVSRRGWPANSKNGSRFKSRFHIMVVFSGIRSHSPFLSRCAVTIPTPCSHTDATSPPSPVQKMDFLKPPSKWLAPM